MTLQHPWAAIALFCATALCAPAVAQTTAGPPAPVIRHKVAISPAPVNAVPDAGASDDPEAGLEAREAMAGVPAEAAPAGDAGTLNAQYAALRTSGAMPTAAEAAPSMGDPAMSEPRSSVALARRVVESAEAFADYMQRAGSLHADYVDAPGVSRALRAGGVYEAGQLQEGAVAYVALAALQDPAFVQAVGDLGRDAAGRPALARQLVADPRLVLHMPGAGEAAARAAAVLGRLGGSLYASGAAVKQSAYDIQRSAWSKVSVAAPEATLAEIKARSAVREGLGADSGQAMLTSLAQLRRPADGGSGRLTPVVNQGLTLAALAVLGEAGEEHADRVAALLTKVSSAQCLKMARLNLYQCLAVAGPNYEDVFCLGQHAMMETARCVAEASGWSPAPVDAPSARVAAPVLQAASIMVPVASVPQATVPAAPAEAETGPMAAPVQVGPVLLQQMAAAGMG